MIGCCCVVLQMDFILAYLSSDLYLGRFNPAKEKSGRGTSRLPGEASVREVHVESMCRGRPTMDYVMPPLPAGASSFDKPQPSDWYSSKVT